MATAIAVDKQDAAARRQLPVSKQRPPKSAQPDMTGTAVPKTPGTEGLDGEAKFGRGSSARPLELNIPASAYALIPSPRHAPWSQMAESHALNEEAASVVGVSIGREQTRLTSPSTPAAEKSAALDRLNSWGFFDDTADDVEKLADIREDEREAQARAPRPDPADDLAGLPSPWVSGPRLHETVKDRERNRSRTHSLFNASLPDINVKHIWQNFNATSLADALHKLAPLNTGSKVSQTPEKRPSRSNSLFGHRMTWGSLGRSHGGGSPRRATAASSTSTTSVQNTPVMRSAPSESPTSSGEGSPKLTSPEIDRVSERPAAHDFSAEARKISSEMDSSARQVRPVGPPLRKSASDGSMLSKTSTKYSFDADIHQFDNIDSMVNSRFKAVKDSWQDSAFRLKNVTANRRLSFKPDFMKTFDEHGYPTFKSLTGIFGDSGSHDERSIRASTPPETPKQPKQSSLDAALEELTGDVVLMGGYRGSVLRSAEPPNRQVWVPIKVGLNVRKVNLEMGLRPEDEETEHERIFASGILSHIGPIDISRRLIRRIRSSKNARDGTLRFHDYGYDWRLSPELLGRYLIKFLEALPCNQPHVHPSKKGATVIAHSLGGLVTRWAVNQRPDLFAGVVYAGTPQHCINILGPFRNGDDVLLSSRVLTAQVNFTLRTSYALLPETGRCFINEETGEEYRVDFFDAKQWEEYRWSPCVGYPLQPNVTRPARSNSILATLRDSVPSLPSLTKSSTDLNGTSSPPRHANGAEGEVAQRNTRSPIQAAEDAVDRKLAVAAHPNENTVNPSMQTPPTATNVATAVTIPHDTAMEYLTRTLADTLRFKRNLSHRVEHEDANAYPPHSVLYSTCVPTVYGAKVASREAIKYSTAYDNLAFAAGDGVVLARASMLPTGYRVCEGGRIRTDRGHVGLLGDLDSVGKCLLSVIEARRRGVGLGNETIAKMDSLQ